MTNTRATIIIKKNDQAAANQWMKDNVDRYGGEFSFTNPLYANNPVTLSHYWCSGLWPDAVVATLEEEYGVDLDKGKNPQAFRVAKGLENPNAQAAEAEV